MLFRFIGRHTNGRESIRVFGVDFVGDEPSDVTDPEGIRRLSQNIEFEPVSKPRGRPRKGGQDASAA